MKSSFSDLTRKSNLMYLLWKHKLPKSSFNSKVSSSNFPKKGELSVITKILRRYHTIKTCRWNFPELFITGKYIETRFKNQGSPCYVLSSRSQKIKNITNIEYTRLFWFTLLVSLLWRFSCKNWFTQ